MFAEPGGRKQPKGVVSEWISVTALEMERRLFVGCDGHRNHRPVLQLNLVPSAR